LQKIGFLALASKSRLKEIRFLQKIGFLAGWHLLSAGRGLQPRPKRFLVLDGVCNLGYRSIKCCPSTVLMDFITDVVLFKQLILQVLLLLSVSQ